MLRIHPLLHMHICIHFIGWVQLCESPRCRESHDCVWVLLQQNGGLWTKNGQNSFKGSRDGRCKYVHLVLPLSLSLSDCDAAGTSSSTPTPLLCLSPSCMCTPSLSWSNLSLAHLGHQCLLPCQTTGKGGLWGGCGFPVWVSPETTRGSSTIQGWSPMVLFTLWNIISLVLFPYPNNPIANHFHYHTQGMSVCLVTWAAVIYKVWIISFICDAISIM